MSLPAATPVSALQLVDTDYTITAKAAVSGTPQPYRFSLLSEANNTNQFTNLTLERTATTSNHPVQTHQWNVSPTHTTCTAGLHSCRIYDGGGFVEFGTFDLNFAPNARATTKDDICGGVVVGTITRRTGLLTGTLRINTGTGYFGVIRNSGTHVRVPGVIPAVAKQTTPNGADCGPVDLPPCITQIGLIAFGADGSLLFTGRAQGDQRTALEVGVSDVTGTKAVTLQHLVGGFVPNSAFMVTSNDPLPLQRAKLKFGGLAPFASGSARFDANADPSDPSGCSTISRPGTLHGHVTLMLDGFGTRLFTSANGSMYRSHA